MSDWLLNLPVVWMAIVIFAATYLFAAVLYTVITALAAGERALAFKGISPGILPPSATPWIRPMDCKTVLSDLRVLI